MKDYRDFLNGISSVKTKYSPGMRIELILMNDQRPIEPGTRGTIISVDDMGTIHVQWDNGRTLGVVPGEDCFRVLPPKEGSNA